MIYSIEDLKVGDQIGYNPNSSSLGIQQFCIVGKIVKKTEITCHVMFDDKKRVFNSNGDERGKRSYGFTSTTPHLIEVEKVGEMNLNIAKENKTKRNRNELEKELERVTSLVRRQTQCHSYDAQSTVIERLLKKLKEVK